MQQEPAIEAAVWAGRHQAFAVIAAHSTAAQAECLRQIRESQAHNQLGLTWEEFCPRYAGTSRRHADRLIQRLEEFGASYFKLAELARVSPQAYRRIAGHIHDDVLEIHGRTIPITPDHAPEIRDAVRRLTHRLHEADTRTLPSVSEFKTRIDAIVAEMKRRMEYVLDLGEEVGLRHISADAARKFQAIHKTLSGQAKT